MMLQFQSGVLSASYAAFAMITDYRATADPVALVSRQASYPYPQLVALIKQHNSLSSLCEHHLWMEIELYSEVESVEVLRPVVTRSLPDLLGYFIS